MATVLEKPTLTAMRDTDYLTTHESVSVPALGNAVECWRGGEGVPPLFIERRSEALTDFNAFLDWVRDNRPILDELIIEHGAIMLRGFPLSDAASYDTLMGLFPRYEPGYVAGMSPRKIVKGQVLESTRLDEKFKISLHSEMAYMKRFPPRISLYSRTTAPVGGETTIGSMREFMKRFPDNFRKRLEGHKVHIVRNYGPAGNTKGMEAVDHPDKIGWDEAFFTESKEEVDALCRSLEIEPIWHEDGSLTLREETDIFTQHPVTGERFYRTNLHTNLSFDRDPNFAAIAAAVRSKQKYPSGHYLDNGEKFTEEETDIILGLYDQVELSWRWQDGDVAILDNLLCAHGRNPFSGPREVLVTLLDR